MKTPATKIIAALLAASASALPLHAATHTWKGTDSANPNYWGRTGNWNGGIPNSADADVFVGVSTGLINDRQLRLTTSPTIRSFTSTLNNLELYTAGTNTLTVGADDAGNASAITMNAAHSSSADAFKSTSSTGTFHLQFAHQITLSGTSATSEYRFSNATLRNTADSTGTDTILFAGASNWGFVSGSAATTALARNSAAATLDVELKSGANAFTGVLRYAAANAMNVDNVRVNSGTLRLENATLATTGNSTVTGLTVGAGGTFGGLGTVNGSATIDGTLEVGTPAASGALTFNDGLTLQTGSETRLDIGGLASFDRVALGGGFLVRGGALSLSLSGTYAEGDSWTLFTGLDGATGSFSSVVLNGQALSQSGNLWNGVYGDLGIRFDQTSGILSLTAAPIPEPASVALLLGVAALGATARRRR